MKRKDPFDTMSKRHLAYRESGARAAMLLSDADALEDLNAFLVALFDLHVYLNRVAWLESRDIRPQLLFFNHVQCVHNVSHLPCTKSGCCPTPLLLRRGVR